MRIVQGVSPVKTRLFYERHGVPMEFHIAVDPPVIVLMGWSVTRPTELKMNAGMYPGLSEREIEIILNGRMADITNLHQVCLGERGTGGDWVSLENGQLQDFFEFVRKNTTKFPRILELSKAFPKREETLSRDSWVELDSSPLWPHMNERVLLLNSKSYVEFAIPTLDRLFENKSLRDFFKLVMGARELGEDSFRVVKSLYAYLRTKYDVRLVG